MPDVYHGPNVQPVANLDTPPKSVDVAIIGGGIIGISAALALASKGLSVGVFEKGTVAGEQSSRNWGWVRIAGRDLREIHLMKLATRLWTQWDEATGNAFGYRRNGIIYVARSPEQRARHERWVAAVRTHDVHAAILEPAAVRDFAPGLQFETIYGGLYTPGDGRAEPQWATSAMAKAAVRKDAQIFQHCAVRGIETQAGKVTAVMTEKGPVRCDTAIIAGGAWSSLLLSGLGVRLPQLKVLSSVFRTPPIDFDIAPCMSFSEFALRKRVDGGFTVASSATAISQIVPDSFRFFRDFLPAAYEQRGGIKLRFGRAFFDEALHWRLHPFDRQSIFETVRTLDPSADRRAVERVRKALTKALPVLGGADIAQSWGGMIDATPDAIPVISEVDGITGLLVGTGFSGHGFGIAPGAGAVLADMAQGKEPSIDVQAFSLSRFSGNATLELQSWL